MKARDMLVQRLKQVGREYYRVSAEETEIRRILDRVDLWGLASDIEPIVDSDAYVTELAERAQALRTQRIDLAGQADTFRRSIEAEMKRRQEP